MGGTRFGQEIRFSPECSTKFSSLPISKEHENFLINTNRKSIALIQVHNQKLLQTWTLPHPHVFTTPVAFCSSDNTISCVKDNNVLMIWPITEEDLKKVSKIKLKNPVFVLISVGSSSTVIVFNSGSIASIEYVASNPQNACKNSASTLGDEEKLVWVNAMLHGKDILVVFITQIGKVNEYFLKTFLMKENTVTPVQSLALKHGKCSLKNWCLHDGWDFPALLTLWNNGQIVTTSLLNGVSENVLSISNVTDSDAVQIDVIGKYYIAVIRAQSSSQKQGTILEVWDLKYAIQKLSKVLKHRISKNLQMKTFGSSVFFSSNEGISLISVETEPSSLASSIGKSTVPATPGGEYSWSGGADWGKLKTYNVLLDDETEFSDAIHSLKSDCKKFKELITSSSSEGKRNFCNELYKLKDIEEKDLIKMLQASLSLENEPYMSQEAEDKNLLLNSIFSIPFTDIFLRQNLKNLVFAEAVESLNYLMNLFDSELMSDGKEGKPSDLQIVNWIQLLVQSHFDQIVLTADNEVLALMKQLQKILLQKMEVYTEMHEIEYLLKIIKKKHILPEASVNTKYCIEVLYL